MSNHEIKYCPSCNQQFECKVGSINLCQCTTIQLTEPEKQFIEEKFDDCLCVNCLQKIKESFSDEVTTRVAHPSKKYNS
jgi:hypothetical protein